MCVCTCAASYVVQVELNDLWCRVEEVLKLVIKCLVNSKSGGSDGGRSWGGDSGWNQCALLLAHTHIHICIYVYTPTYVADSIWSAFDCRYMCVCVCAHAPFAARKLLCYGWRVVACNAAKVLMRRWVLVSCRMHFQLQLIKVCRI